MLTNKAGAAASSIFHFILSGRDKEWTRLELLIRKSCHGTNGQYEMPRITWREMQGPTMKGN
jgi:hypothetical protein